MLVAINTDQEVILINRKGCEILGYKENEIIGRNWFDHFIPERDRNGVKGVFAELIAGDIESVECLENTVLSKSGMEKIVAWHNTIITDEKGHIMGTISSGEDITEHKRAEDALRESEKRYRTLAEAASDMIFIVDGGERLEHGVERTAQLEASNKELEAFIFCFHDLRAHCEHRWLLTSNIGRYIDKLDDEGKRLNIIRNNTQKMGQLIDDLLVSLV